MHPWIRHPRRAWRLRGLGARLRLGAGVALDPDVRFQIGRLGRVHIGDRAAVRRGGDLKVDGVLEVGADTLIGPWCVISALHAVRIGRDVLLAERVSIRDHDHEYRGEGPIRLQGYKTGAVVIGDGAWIGANCVVRHGVELGAGCVVGANSVVTRSFPPGSVIAGAPARLIRTTE